MRRWIFRILSTVVVVLALFLAFVYVVQVYPRRLAHPPLELAKGAIAIEHARIYVSPTDAPIDDGTVLMRDGLIAAVGTSVQVPSDAVVLPS